MSGLLQHPPPSPRTRGWGSGRRSRPEKFFWVVFGGGGPTTHPKMGGGGAGGAPPPPPTTQKLGFGAQPQDVASAVGKWVVVLANLVNVGV
jgi:hypothetical protein